MKNLFTVFFLIFLVCTPLNASSLKIRVSVSSIGEEQYENPNKIRLPQLKLADAGATAADAFDLDTAEAPLPSSASPRTITSSLKLKVRTWISEVVNKVKANPHAAFLKNVFTVSYECATQKRDASHCSSILTGLKDAAAKYKTNIPKLIQTVEAVLASRAPEADFDSYDGPGLTEYISIALIIASIVGCFLELPLALVLFPAGMLLEGIKIGLEKMDRSSRESAWRREDEMKHEQQINQINIYNQEHPASRPDYDDWNSRSSVNNPHVSDNTVDNSQQNQIRNQNGINGNRNSIDNSYHSDTTTTTTTNTNSNNSVTKLCLFGCNQEAEIDEATENYTEEDTQQ